MKKIKNKKRFLICVISLMLLVFLCVSYLGYDLYRPYLLKIKNLFAYQQKQTVSLESLGFKKLENSKSFLYVNNKLQRKERVTSDADNKIIERSKDLTRLYDFATGFVIDLPDEMSPDFTQSPVFVKMCSDFLDVTISKEYSPYEDVDEYISYYLNRFITSEDYRKPNSMELLGDSTFTYGENSARLISVKILDMPEDKKNIYTYATIKTGGREFFRFMFKFKASNYMETEKVTASALESFKRTSPFGTAVYDF